METWTLEHPEQGRIQVEWGFDSEFLAEYPDWPGRPADAKEGEPFEAGVHPAVDAGFVERCQAWVLNPSLRLQISVNGEVRRQLDSVPNGRVPLRGFVKENDLISAASNVPRDKPHLKIHSNSFGDIYGIDYREGAQVVEFPPPPGSRGYKRHEAMESSAFKRFFYPLLAGLGKGGWALGVLVLGPLIGRFIEWLLSFVPDVDLPSLPPLPDVTLPVPDLPELTLPVPHLPDWQLPQFDIPPWIVFMIEYSKVWVPVVVAIAIGVLALRNHRKSEKQKRQWEMQGERRR